MLKIENLYKWYGSKLAVNNISLELKKGEVLGFIGPNGAGKSTTMRMLTGFLPISKGKIEIDGIDITKNAELAKSKFGYLPENAPLYMNMTILEFLTFCTEIRGYRGKEIKIKVKDILEKCFLDDVKNQTIHTLSKGYRHRTCFAQSIIHNPDFLILDEPTDGLDPNQKYEIRNIIKEFGKEKAVLLSTHILEEVEMVCDRVIIINQGSKIYDGTPQALKNHFGSPKPLDQVFREMTTEKSKE